MRSARISTQPNDGADQTWSSLAKSPYVTNHRGPLPLIQALQQNDSSSDLVRNKLTQ
jgi:hypothetical protein